VLRYNTLNPSEHSEAELMNYVQVDANKLEFQGEALLSLLKDIFGVIIAVTLGVYFIGFPIIFLICSMIVINIFLYFTFKWEMQMNHTIMKAKDERVGFMKSILSNITYIKSRAWENLFLYRLYQKRLKEIQAIRRYGYVLALEVFLDWVNPSLAMSTIFIYKIYFSESEMDIGSFSGFMKEFNALKNIMISLPLNIALIIETYASLKRINKFLWAEEKEDYCESITELDEARKGELNITNGEFAWDNTLNSQKDDRSLDKNPAAFIPISNKDSMLKYSLID